MSRHRRTAAIATPPGDDRRRRQLRTFHAWLVEQDPAALAALALYRDETEQALREVESWFQRYAEAFRGKT